MHNKAKQHELAVTQLYTLLNRRHYFDIVKKNVEGYGINPKNVQDILQTDILCQKRTVLYLFEIKIGKNWNVQQLLDRYDGFMFNREDIVIRQKALPNFDYIRLFLVVPGGEINEINRKGKTINHWTWSEFLQNPSIIQ